MTSFRVVLVCSCILTLKSFIGESLLTEYWTSPKPPINLYQDDNPPFYHGVSSGDPLPDSIILWTRATPRTQVEIDDGLDVEWRIWDLVNSTETAPELTGIARATEERDWTVKVDVRPLAHTNRTYFYKFYVDSGANSSRLGRTRTAPDPEADGGILTFAVTSCTQHQQYISGLAHMAYNMTLGGEVDPSLQSWTDENLDKTEAINAFIHLGDYLYETNELTTYQRTWTGSCESKRPDLARDIPNRESNLDPAFGPAFTSFQDCSIEYDTIPDWKYRHSLIRMDPDRRAALAAHPIIILVDSHDANMQGEGSLEDRNGLSVFEMWTPVRWQRYNDSDGIPSFRLFRSFRFGKLADVVLMDTRNVGRNKPGGATYLGEDQIAWLREDILNPSNATDGWRIMGSGKAFVAWNVDGYQGFVLEVAFSAIAVAVIPLAACVFSSKYVKRREVEASVLALSSDSARKVEEAGSIHWRTKRDRMAWTCVKCCGGKKCIVCGVCVTFLPILLSIIVLVIGSIVITSEDDTGRLNPFAKSTTWDENAIDRAELMKDIADTRTPTQNGNIFISGDMHMLAVNDVKQSSAGHRILPGRDITARNIPDYAATVANESFDRVGIELLPSSTSSRGVDDFLYLHVPFASVIQFVADTVGGIIQRGTEDMLHFDTVQHGVGYIHLDEGRAEMEFYRNDIFFPFRQSELTWRGNALAGQNRWNTYTTRVAPVN